MALTTFVSTEATGKWLAIRLVRPEVVETVEELLLLFFSIEEIPKSFSKLASGRQADALRC